MLSRLQLSHPDRQHTAATTGDDAVSTSLVSLASGPH